MTPSAGRGRSGAAALPSRLARSSRTVDRLGDWRPRLPGPAACPRRTGPVPLLDRPRPAAPRPALALPHRGPAMARPSTACSTTFSFRDSIAGDLFGHAPARRDPTGLTRKLHRDSKTVRLLEVEAAER